jgi:glycerol-3-phosphate O-acyltransferase
VASAPALFRAPPAAEIALSLQARFRRRAAALSDTTLADLLADTVFHERKRVSHDGGDPGYLAAIEAAALAVHDGDRAAHERAAHALVHHYADEIHNPFSPRTYRFATRVLPGALTHLLSASRARDLFSAPADPASRVRISGPLEQIRALSERATLILAPTHVSNLDSPLIGYTLFAAGLPPFAYGAGLNLFTNPVMGFFMQRLGAYTVDRRKRNRLYKAVLKDYSVDILGRGHHSLFFPGGTRSRSGKLEAKLKKGLLGTGLEAWQESITRGRERPTYIVPCTLSMGLVLEAESLIADALAEEGKQRYIIMDDEFSEPRTIATFVQRLLSLDAAVHVRFGEPMDVVGNPIDTTGASLDPAGRRVDPRGYVCDRHGAVVADEQRDHLYTQRVADRLSDAYHRDFVVQSTHLAAWAAWSALRHARPGRDTWRLVRLTPAEARVPRAAVLRRIADALPWLAGRQTALPTSPEAILDEALHRFATFHRRRALATDEASVVLAPELVLYYQNRLVGWPEFA